MLTAHAPADVFEQTPTYHEQMRAIPLLTLDQEITLGLRIARGRDAERVPAHARTDDQMRAVCDGQDAQRTMVEHNLRLAANEAAKLVRRGVEYADLVQFANLGLMRAAAKFDVTKGHKFSTYATWWIRQQLLRAFDDTAREIRLPVHACDSVKRINRVTAELAIALERNPTIREIAQAAGLTEEKTMHLIRMSAQIASLDAPRERGDEDVDPLHTTIAAPERDPIEGVYVEQVADGVQSALGNLSERERAVLCLRFGIGGQRPHTLEEVGAKIETTRERARQIERDALAKLRTGRHAQHLRALLDTGDSV